MVGGVRLVPSFPVSEKAMETSVHVDWWFIVIKDVIRIKRAEWRLRVKRVRVGGQLVVSSHVVISTIVFGWSDLGVLVVVRVTELTHLFNGEHLVSDREMVVFKHLNDFSCLSKGRLKVNQIIKRLWREKDKLNNILHSSKKNNTLAVPILERTVLSVVTYPHRRIINDLNCLLSHIRRSRADNTKHLPPE